MLDADELACMRADMEETLGQQAIIQRGESTNVGGQEAITFTPDADTTPCRVAPFRSSREVLLANEVRAFVDAEIKMPWPTAISKIDQIQVGADLYAVVGHDSGRTDATLLTVQVVRVLD